MLKHLSRTRVIGAWVVAIVIATIVSVGLGAAATSGTWTLLFLMALTPPAIALMVWRGAPPPTAAELLYSVRHANGGR